MRGCGEGVRGKAIEQQRAQGSQPPAHIFMASLLLALLPPAALLLLAVAVLVAAHGATRSPRCRVGEALPATTDTRGRKHRTHLPGKTMNREKSKGMHGSRGAMQVRHFPPRSESRSFAPCWCLAGANQL